MPPPAFRARGSPRRVEHLQRAPRGLSGHLYGMCPDDLEVTAQEHLRFDASIEVPDGFTRDDRVALGEIPAGTYAVAVHRGPFETLADMYLDLIGRWIPTSGRELTADAEQFGASRRTQRCVVHRRGWTGGRRRRLLDQSSALDHRILQARAEERR